MTAVQEIQKRNEKAQNLRAIQVGEGEYFVESETGGVAYRVMYEEGKENACTCGDFAKNIKGIPQFKCKHILAVMNCEQDIETARFLERSKPKLDERFIITVDDQDFAKYAGLLDLAHQKRLTSLDVEILQYPTKENENMAICKAKAQTAMGEIFSDIGDANPTNCNYRVAKHLLRMASTRAKARALRDLTNIGMTALEELGGLDEVIGAEERGTVQKGKVKSFPKKVVQPEARPGNGNGGPPAARAADTSKTTGNAPGPGNGESKEPTKKAEETAKSDDGNGQAQVKASEKSGGNGKGKTKPESEPKISDAQYSAIMNLSRRRGISVEDLDKKATEAYGVPVKSLSPANASSMIRTLQQSA